MFKYVPVLRYRQEERGALKSLKLTTKTLPLVEIIMEKPKSNMKNEFDKIYTKDFNDFRLPIMVDIPLYFPTQGAKAAVQNFLRPIQNNYSLRINRFLSLQKATNIIPVLTYDPRKSYKKGHIITEEKSLRSAFNRLAFRVFYPSFNESINDIKSVLRANDILIFDLDAAPQNNQAFKQIYTTIKSLKLKHKCYTVLVRSSIPSNVSNVSLVDDQPIAEADNSLVVDYKTLGFDAFGDYAGIKKSQVKDGGTVSPGLIFYSWKHNVYIGYRYKDNIRNLEQFKDHIIPTLLSSSYWSEFSKSHKMSCPGCKTILNVNKGFESGKSQAKWKRVSIMHYIHTMEESL